VTDFEARLSSVREKVNKANLEKARLQERVEHLSLQRQEILKSLKECGVDDPGQLDSYIKQLEQKIERQLSSAEQTLKEVQV